MAVSGSVNGVAPQAARVVDGGYYAVALDLEPIAVSLLTDIACAVHATKDTWRLVALARLDPADPDRARHLAALTVAVRRTGALRPLISGAAAEQLAAELDDAAAEPGWCEVGGCDRYADVDGMCPAHAAALDLAAEGW